MKRKVFYYTDEVNEDFAKTHLKRPPVDENYKYIRSNKFNIFFSAIMYYLIAKPILSIIARCMGVRVKNKKNLKLFKKQGLFIYANHTSYLDAFVIQTLVGGFKRTDILGYSDASAIPFIKHICRACGYMPLPTTLKGSQKFLEAITYYIKKGQNILIYPEAHIWPTFTQIRPFVKTSFHYPAKIKAPIFPIVTIYRKSKLSKHAKMTLVVGEAIYPRSDLNELQNKTYLRDMCYEQMVKISTSYNQYRYHKFIKKDESKKD